MFPEGEEGGKVFEANSAFFDGQRSQSMPADAFR